MSRWLVGVAIAIGLAVIWTGVVASPGSSASLGPFPAFALPELTGDVLDETMLEGRVTVVNFWASWCPPCRSEAPILARVDREMSGGAVQFLGVLHRDERAPAIDFAMRAGLDFPTVVDDGSLAGRLGVRAIPTTFIVGPDGQVLARHFGPIQEARLRVLIDDARAATADMRSTP